MGCSSAQESIASRSLFPAIRPSTRKSAYCPARKLPSKQIWFRGALPRRGPRSNPTNLACLAWRILHCHPEDRVVCGPKDLKPYTLRDSKVRLELRINHIVEEMLAKAC